MALVGDDVDDVIGQWRAVRPDLALRLDAMATFGRLGRLHAHASKAIEAVLLTHGLSVGEFDVLAALRRSGEPHELTPTALSRLLMLSPAGMTNRIDRLERAGHVERRADPGDRRSSLIGLTPAGLALVDRAVGDHVANEAQLLAAFTPAQRREFDALLRALLAHVAPR